MKAKFSIVVVMILSISLCLLMACCSKLFPDEDLTLQREDYTGNELRTDGYYYSQETTEEYSHTVVEFLYRNGVTIQCGAFLTTDLNIVEKELPSRYKGLNKMSFGIFLINDNEILMEGWSTSLGGRGLPTQKSKGYIENDTTYCITEAYLSDTKETYYGDKIWHFKQFDHKPDSTNNFIK